MAWSRSHEHCTRCRRTDRRHEGKGLCRICYPNYRHPALARFKKKQRRLHMSDAQYQKQIEATRLWRERNRDHIRHYNARRRKTIA